jgi:hypothetical protein
MAESGEEIDFKKVDWVDLRTGTESLLGKDFAIVRLACPVSL